MKDIIDTHDMPTGHNSPIFKGKVPFGDAACVALCRTANAVILGKTVTTEFANRHPGPTTNPHNAAHTPGGSSSGSAAAVADGQVPLAFGTQTGGSVIRPAAYCGVIGYKPTFGDFSRVGIKMQCHSVDTLGLMARTLDDIALFRAAVLKLPPVRIDRGIARPRIGFCRTPIWDEASPDTKALLEKTASKLADKGASVVDVAFAAPFADILDDHGAITNYEGTRNYADERLRNPDKVSKELMEGAMKRGLEVSFDALCRRPAQVHRLPRPYRFDVRQGRRPALPQRAGRSAGRRRVHRRSALQFDLDPGGDALRYAAGRQRRQGPAARLATGRAAPRGQPAALHRRVGRGPFGLMME